MTGKEILEKLQSFSPEELDQEVYICGADCLVNYAESISVNEEEYTDEDGNIIPAGALVVDW
jgi:hypothetical protein